MSKMLAGAWGLSRLTHCLLAYHRRLKRSRCEVLKGLKKCMLSRPGGELIGVSQNHIRYDLFLLPYGKEPI